MHRQKNSRTPTVRQRILISLILLVIAALAPWWVAVALAALLLLRYNAYEIIIVGLFIDALYGTPQANFFGYQFFTTALLTAAALLAPLLKRGIIYYS